MNLQHELLLRTTNSSLREIALLMGYSPRQAVKATNRVHRVITCTNLGLDSGNYDFKYSNAEFVLKLCEVLDMDMTECSHQVEKLSDELFKCRFSYKPWIFVDTGFKRKSEPIFALAFMEGHRRLPVSKEIASLPMEQQIEHIQKIIQNHYEQSGGRLDMWGRILKYRYFNDENQSITFDTGGNVVETGDGSCQPPAKLTHKGHDITKIILE